MRSAIVRSSSPTRSRAAWILAAIGDASSVFTAESSAGTKRGAAAGAGAGRASRSVAALLIFLVPAALKHRNVSVALHFRVQYFECKPRVSADRILTATVLSRRVSRPL